MRLRKILIGDFGGFPHHEVLDLGLGGKSLLVFGENGAGKSTIFNAVDRFFLSSVRNTPISQYKNLFLKSTDLTYVPDVHVKLVFGPVVAGEVQDIPANTYEWTDGAIPSGSQIVKSTAKLPSRLDYRAMLSTHFVHRESRYVDLYDLIVSALLPSLENGVTANSFGSEKARIQELKLLIDVEHDDARKAAQVTELKNVLRDHGAGLGTLSTAIQAEVRRFLKFFKDGQSVRLEVIAGSFDDARGELNFPQVRLHARLHSRDIPRHHVVINEARLTSVSLCIYLAAIKHQAATLDGLGEDYLKILVLDDVLIGLDMANRYPVLTILRNEFSDWQTILLTYDRIWFDMVVETIDVRNWEVYEAFRTFDIKAGFDRPRLVPRLEGAVQTKDHLLARADSLWAQGDFRGTAVYARAAFEIWAKHKATSKKLHVTYNKEAWRQPINDIWRAIKTSIPATEAAKQAKILALENSKAIVLNPWSHASGSAVVAADVQTAVAAVRGLW